MRYLALLLPLALVGCSTVDRNYPVYPSERGYGYGYGHGPEIGSPEIGYERGYGRGGYGYELAPKVLDIPRGHLPPPGLSRIWFPHRPPGHQPPPGEYRYLINRVPPGAWLINVPARDPNHVHIAFFDSHRPSHIVDRGIYFRDRGRLIREDR
jgi:hypothetical protein